MPTTEAGKRLLDFLRETPRFDTPREQAYLRRRIDAIEAEARATAAPMHAIDAGLRTGREKERERIRAAVERRWPNQYADVRAVIAIIDREDA